MAFNQPDIVPGMAVAIHRSISEAPKRQLSEQTLQRRLLPDQSRAGEKIFLETLRELRAIDAITAGGDNLKVARQGDFRDVLLDCAAEHARVNGIWQRDDEGFLQLLGALDLMRAAAFLMTLPTARPAWTWEGTQASPGFETVQGRHLREKFVRNSERWRPFVRWAVFFGFADSLGGYAIVANPARLIARIGRDLLKVNVPVPLGTAVEMLGQAVPALEGGEIFDAVSREEELEERETLTPATSLALWSLRDAGVVTLDEGRGDAEKWVLADGLGAYHSLTWRATA